MPGKNQFFQFVLLLLMATFMWACFGQSNSETLSNVESVNSSDSQKIDELIGIYNFNEGFSGAVLVAQGGHVIFQKGYGKANREWDIPNESDTKFRIASVSKPFTSVIILQMVAEKLTGIASTHFTISQ